jgi:hypothetical protein
VKQTENQQRKYKSSVRGVGAKSAPSGDEMKFRTIASAVVLMLVFTVVFAHSGSQNSSQTPDKKGEQAAQPNPFSTFNKFAYARVKTILVSSAEKMPEENYNFKPTDAVRSSW